MPLRPFMYNSSKELPYDPQASQPSGLSSEQLMSLWFCSTRAIGSRVPAACFSTVNLMASAAALVRR